MFESNIDNWFAILLLLIPFWWVMALLLVALIGDTVPKCRGPVSHFVDPLQHIPALTEESPAFASVMVCAKEWIEKVGGVIWYEKHQGQQSSDSWKSS